MAGLFEISDFALFEKYAHKTQSEAPEAQGKLRLVYDKLGKITEGLNKLGYPTKIRRNPLTQAQKYCEYHWARVYPKNQDILCQECWDIVFFVVGTTEDGINIHIDSNERDGYKCNTVSRAIRDNTWVTIPPDKASTLSCEELVQETIKYIEVYWKEFNLFAKEFGIQESIKILNNMEIEKIKKSLLDNYNIVLTGAPGTGKTYLAKQIAKAIGAKWKLVQFHPSYDYTDFVEGLRPIKKGEDLGFERKDGVFKEFCKKAIKSANRDIEEALKLFHDDLSKGRLTIKSHKKNSTEFDVELGDKNYKIFTHTDNCPENGYDCAFDAVKKYIETGKYIEGHQTYQPSIGEYVKEKYMKNQLFVFIIDEINRGEISKIFGELFYSIDRGYRGESGKVDTQYQNLIPNEGDTDFDTTNPDVFRNGFYVPDNVYIIGTMNDIDRSVESMDFAMRRRFAWKEITAKSRQSMLDEDGAWEGNKPEQPVINEIKNRMNNLNDCIIDKYGNEELSPKDKVGLTKAYQIGASYFLKYSLYGNFDELWTNHLEGLLYEYLRGSTNIETKIERLHKAYNDTEAH